eukprot:4056468-Alexandrium_andersonii.AAC.1
MCIRDSLCSRPTRKQRRPSVQATEVKHVRAPRAEAAETFAAPGRGGTVTPSEMEEASRLGQGDRREDAQGHLQQGRR